jgi:phenylpyruvate tautomerase PptA (4-oxalocrotonate tautomerase family)
MPNVTIYIPADRMPPDEALADLTEQCTDLCTGILRAALATVHIVYVAVRHGRGHPAFAEVQYRLEPFRTPPVMDRFMEELDEAIKRNIGLAARIRCFGYEASSIHARH